MTPKEKLNVRMIAEKMNSRSGRFVVWSYTSAHIVIKDMRRNRKTTYKIKAWLKAVPEMFLI